MFKTAKACGVGPCVAVDLDFNGVGSGHTKAVTSARIIAVRDTKLGDASPTPTFTQDEWFAFITGVKKGEFDV